MPQFRDQAGNIWEGASPDDPNLRLVSQGGPQPIAPPNPMQSPQLQRATAEARVADETVDAQIRLANAQASAAQAEANKKIAEASGGGETTGQAAVDREYAKEFVDWRAAGGYAGLESKLKLLEDATRVLESSDKLTGPVIGRLPKFVQQAIDPRSVDVRADVERVIQQSLRQILGGQFAMREADQLFARSFDPEQQEASNVQRIRATIDELRGRAIAQESAAQFFEKNGTLAGWQGPTREQVSAFDVIRTVNTQGPTEAAKRADVGAGQTIAQQYPPEMVNRHDAMVNRLLSEGGGRIDPQAYAAAREELFSEFGYNAGHREGNESWANSINQYIEAGGRTIPSGILPEERIATATEAMRNNLINNPASAAGVGAANMLAGGIPEMVAPGQFDALRDAQGGFVLAGEALGAIPATMALGGIGRAAASRVAPQLLQGGARGQFARNVATDATLGGIYGGTTQGDPIGGAGLGAGGSAIGQGLARGLGAAVGGAQISDAARTLRNEGVPISVARQMGLGRAEDTLQSIPIVGDMSRARQLDSFQGLNQAMLRRAGEPIGFNPTRIGREGVEDFGQARSQAYTDAVQGVDAPLDATFIERMQPIEGMMQNMSRQNRGQLAESLRDALQIPADAGQITPQQFQDAMSNLRALRANAKGVMPNSAQTLRKAATTTMDALEDAMGRAGGQDVIEGLQRANMANRGVNVAENAILDRAAIGTQAGQPNLATPAQWMGALRQSERRGYGDLPAMRDLATAGQEVLPSVVPNSGTADRAIAAGLLGSVGLGAGLGGAGGFAGGGENAGADAASGAQSGAMTAGSLAAALALLGTRGGQRALETMLINRPQAAQTFGQGIRRRGGIFGSAAVPVALEAM
jgi:hypothetical protein